MKIVHFIETLDLRHGGPPVVIARLAAEQARQGHQVVLLTTYDSAESDAQCRDTFASFMGFDAVVRCSTDARTVAQRFEALAGERLAATVRNADAVHAHALWDPMLLRAVEHCRLRNIPVCLTPHGALARWSLEQKRWKKRLALALAWKRALRRLSLLHLLTEAERTDVDSLSLNRPAVVVPNGVDPREFAAGSAGRDLDAVLPRGASRRFILFLGRLAYVKGLDILCDAFAQVARRLPDVDLVIAGPDYFGYRETLVRRIAALGIGPRIHLIGPVSGAAKSALLKSALCLCQPSRSEGFSMTILEALACGVPAVVSTQCHFPEIQSRGAGIVVPVGAEAIAAALLDLLSRPGALSAASQSARRLIEERYTIAAVSARLVECYRAIGPRWS